ncbi:helix-turn-helix transcriptional regulator [Periweissella cryptocerci]|nr:response regulator transcription factor [Periweissella cryptocerci]
MEKEKNDEFQTYKMNLSAKTEIDELKLALLEHDFIYFMKIPDAAKAIKRLKNVHEDLAILLSRHDVAFQNDFLMNLVVDFTGIGLSEGQSHTDFVRLREFYRQKINEIKNSINVFELICEIITRYGRLYESHLPDQPPVSKTVLLVKDYVNIEMFNDVTPKMIADALGFAPRTLYSTFKTETGISLPHYIRNCKLEEAKNLLRNTGMTITEIASMLNYFDSGAFSKAFKEYMGILPSSYRRDSEIPRSNYI